MSSKRWRGRRLTAAKSELKAARRAYSRMLNTVDPDEFESEWRAVLAALEKAWVKIERDCKDIAGFQQLQHQHKAELKGSEPFTPAPSKATLSFALGTAKSTQHLFGLGIINYGSNKRLE